MPRSFLFLIAVLSPSLLWAQTKDLDLQNLSSREFLAFVTCGSEAEVSAAVQLRNRQEQEDFARRRQDLRQFLKNAEAEIRDALQAGDRLEAGLICAWADDLTLGFTQACPDEAESSVDLVSQATLELCQSLIPE